VNTLFADAFYWIALLNRQDAAHLRASQFANSQSARKVTTEWVLAEVCDGFASSQKRRAITQLRELWKADSRLMIVEATHEPFERGLDLYCSRPDKEWSLTDCISFEVMREHGVTNALTGDHHFAQAGFVPLLAE
jgi:uncharacterized protein